ncbi:MAG: DUF1045 domain-containing protein [Hyphomicrobiaceae bacterium]
MTRYAIYFLPAPETALGRFGSSMIGYDAVSARDVAPPDHVFFCHEKVRELSEEPRRYGFHATLKAPFELCAGASEADLRGRAAELAGRCPRVRLGRLEVAELSSFLALRPVCEHAAARRLAERCVEAFDDLRGPMSAADRARRLAKPLTERQLEHLARWGYPYVFDEFRFHMTLTGPLPVSLRASALSATREIYAAVDRPVTIDALSLVRQTDRSGRFVLVERYPLAGSGEAT